MKTLLMLTAVSCLFAGQSLPALADASAAQRQQIQEARAAFNEAVKTEAGCKAMCEEMMTHKKSKRMMVEMMRQDPEAMKMLTSK